VKQLKLVELLNMLNSKEYNIAKIAKEKLPIGEKKLKSILADLGFIYVNTGNKHWKYEGDESLLDADLMNFVGEKKLAKTNSKSTSKVASNKDSKTTSAIATKEDSTVDINQDIAIAITSTSKPNINANSDSTSNIEIKMLIEGKKAKKEQKSYKGIYFDSDIANFLDNIQTGNKSEIVNKIMRIYLKENDLI
jgi:hypothetical protein